MELNADGTYTALSAGGRALARELGITPRPPKRAKKTWTFLSGSERATLPDNDEWGVVPSREVRSRGESTKKAWRSVVGSREEDTGDWTVEAEWVIDDDPDFALDPAGADWYDVEVTGSMEQSRVFLQEGVAHKKKRKNKRSRRSTRPHIAWIREWAQAYCDEMMRHESRGECRTLKSCVECETRREQKKGPPTYRCRDCYMDDLLCSRCCLRRHRLNPLHRIEVSNVLLIGAGND